MTRRGFTLVEILIAIAIMGILAGTMTLSGNSAGQTARKEAEKVAALISSAVQRADRMNLSFDVKINNDNVISVDWSQNAPKHMTNNPLKASKGCKYVLHNNTSSSNLLSFTYAPMNYPNSVLVETRKDTPTLPANRYYIEVTGKSGHYYVLISGDYRSR